MFMYKLTLIVRLFKCDNKSVLGLIEHKLNKPELTYSDKEWLRKIAGR